MKVEQLFMELGQRLNLRPYKSQGELQRRLLINRHIERTADSGAYQYPEVPCGRRGQVQTAAPFLAVCPSITFIMVTFEMLDRHHVFVSVHCSESQNPE